MVPELFKQLGYFIDCSLSNSDTAEFFFCLLMISRLGFSSVMLDVVRQVVSFPNAGSLRKTFKTEAVVSNRLCFKCSIEPIALKQG